MSSVICDAASFDVPEMHFGRWYAWETGSVRLAY